MCNDISINKYISNEYSICREERQYALYLSNVLRYYGKAANRNEENYERVKKVFEACGFKDLENIVIENVYYEATFMRDIFERNRRYYLAAKDSKNPEDEYSKIRFEHKDYMVSTNNSFNYKLLDFCRKIVYDGESSNDEMGNKKIAERNYGVKDNFIGELKSKESRSGELKLEDLNIKKVEKEKSEEDPENFKKWNEFKTLVRAMMNAKPDLAVIYYDNNEKSRRKLLFIECKYCSGEGYYTYDISDNQSKTKKSIRQRAVQGYIAEFLCEFSGYMNEIDVPEKLMDNKERKENEGKYQSKMVEFVAGHAKENKGQINIKDLIEVEKEIFDK